MAAPKDDLEKVIRIFLDEIRKTYRLDSAYLFGSHAKGTSNQWSDIDLAVVSPDFSEDLYEELLALIAWLQRLTTVSSPGPSAPICSPPVNPSSMRSKNTASN